MLSAKDICDIIKACKGSGISELSVGDLIIRRGVGEDTALVDTPIARSRPILEEKVGVESLAEQEQMTKEDQLALLRIENPLEYERLLIAQDLIDSTEGADDGQEHSGAEPDISRSRNR